MGTDQDAMVVGAEAPTAADAGDPEAWMAHGWALFGARRFGEAVGAAQQAAELAPDDANPHQLMGRAYLDDDRVDQACEAFQRAIKLDGAYVEPYVSLGVLHFWRTGDYGAALDSFEHALALDPDHPWARAQMGMTFAYMGRAAEAIASLAETVHLQPDNERALENLAMVHLAQGRYDEAIATCRLYVTVNPEVNDPHRIMGYALGQLGRYEEAITALGRAVVLSPGIYEIRGTLARLLRAVGRYAEADRHHAIAADQAAADDDFGRASFAAVCDDSDRALALLEVALAEGQTDLGWLRVDPDLVLLRADPRFRALIEA